MLCELCFVWDREVALLEQLVRHVLCTNHLFVLHYTVCSLRDTLSCIRHNRISDGDKLLCSTKKDSVCTSHGVF